MHKIVGLKSQKKRRYCALLQPTISLYTVCANCRLQLLGELKAVAGIPLFPVHPSFQHHWAVFNVKCSSSHNKKRSLWLNGTLKEQLWPTTTPALIPFPSSLYNERREDILNGNQARQSLSSGLPSPLLTFYFAAYNPYHGQGCASLAF